MSQLTDTFTGIANAIRNKTGSSSAFTPAQMITEIGNIPTGKPIIEPYKYESSTITNYNGNEELILDNAFQYCIALSTISFPQCTYIGNYAFNSCYKLSTISFPQCTYIGIGVFNYCSSLKTASFPQCSYINNGAFDGCSALTTISFPECTYIGYNAFDGCSALTTISFPECSYISGNAFYNCRSLTTASFPQCTYISDYAFQRCSNLISLYLLTSTVPSLYNSNAFNNTPLSAGGSGTIYVKSSLVTAFKAATNWSYLSKRIVGI